jgi:hypothetical protein
MADAADIAVPVEPPSDVLMGPNVMDLFVDVDPLVLLLLVKLVFFFSLRRISKSSFMAALCSPVTVTDLDPAVPVMFAIDTPVCPTM